MLRRHGNLYKPVFLRVLSLALFFFYLTYIGSIIRLYADDTSLFIIVENPDTAADLNLDVEKIMTWAKTWLVSFNPKKKESLLNSPKLNKPIHPPLLIDIQVIIEVDSHKHLGVFFSNDSTWRKHIGYVKGKALGRINGMRRLKFCLDRKSLETI